MPTDLQQSSQYLACAREISSANIEDSSVAPDLIDRLRALVAGRNAVPVQAALTVGRLSIDPECCEVVYDANPLHLTAMEFKILHTLAQKPGKVYSREEIAMAVRGESADTADRAVDAHIKTIRRKLGAGAADIQTVRGFGYRLHRPAA